MEIIITIIILGLMASLALPRFSRMTELGRAGEAIEILSALHSSQVRYCLEHNDCSGGYCPGNNYGVYDVDINAPKYHNFPVCDDASGLIVIADNRATAQYQFNVTNLGVFSCTNLNGSSACSLLNRIVPP